MLKVVTVTGNSFEFDADTWQSCNPGLMLFKSGAIVAEFSDFQSVQVVPPPVAQTPTPTPTPEPEPEPEPPILEDGEPSEDAPVEP